MSVRDHFLVELRGFQTAMVLARLLITAASRVDGAKTFALKSSLVLAASFTRELDGRTRIAAVE
jgi:hypothetical protein